MSNQRSRTPWPTTDPIIVTDGGLETWLLFDRGVDLPAFAAYPLAGTADGRALLAEYYGYYAEIARSADAAAVLEAPTWRANPDWAATIGHDRAALADLIVASIGVVEEVRDAWQGSRPFLISGCVGPRGDGYRIDAVMDADAAAAYHSFQIGHMADAGVDVVTAMTMGYVDEAVGVVRAARAADIDVVISFTVETDGRLPSGQPLGEAIEATDAATDDGPLHYMVNCAHTTHFADVLDIGSRWVNRIGGVRANASRLSHAELDEMTELDDGDPDDLALRYADLRGGMPGLRVVGGCCGTDHRHVGAIVRACSAG